MLNATSYCFKRDVLQRGDSFLFFPSLCFGMDNLFHRDPFEGLSVWQSP